MQNQLKRLFGVKSRFSNLDTPSNAEWRKVLRAVLRELDFYIAKNVDTDELHKTLLLSGLAAANSSLDEEEFWPGYVEGITRFALLLLGDYPDHRKRRPGRKSGEHYNLRSLRSVQWAQTPEQRFRTLFAAANIGFEKLSESPQEALRNFRKQCGFGPDHADFMEWYRKHYRHDYAMLFR